MFFSSSYIKECMSGPKECKYFPNLKYLWSSTSNHASGHYQNQGKHSSHFSISEYILNLHIGVFTLMHKQQIFICNIQIPRYTEGQLICLVINN